MKPYADSNFLTRCYLRLEALPASDTALERLLAAGGTLPVFWLHRLEVSNAFEQHVFVSRTLGQTRVTSEMAAAAHARFESDCAEPASLLRFAPLDLSDIERQFLELSRRYTAKHGFRTYDLLHVSAARLLDCDAFWTFDDKATKLASLEGFARLPSATRL